MLRLFVLLFSLILVINAHDDILSSGYRYFKDIDGWLKLHRVPSTWDEARHICQFEGAILASPISKEMLQSMVRMKTDNTTIPCVVFTGMNSIYTNGIYHSIEGVPLSNTVNKWAMDMPGAYGTTKCGVKFNDCLGLRGTGTIVDVDCNLSFPYICYRKNVPISGDTCTCGTKDPGYILSKSTGSCYKFHRTGQTWSQASFTCASEGGHLAVTNSQAEARVLAILFDKNPPETIVADFKDIVSLGFLDWYQRGHWTTVHGLSLYESGFSSWGPGQPDNAKGSTGRTGQHCGAMFRTALLDDVWCNVKLAFICEKSQECNDVQSAFKRN